MQSLIDNIGHIYLNVGKPFYFTKDHSTRKIEPNRSLVNVGHGDLV